jgi:hypothetical protein
MHLHSGFQVLCCSHAILLEKVGAMQILIAVSQCEKWVQASPAPRSDAYEFHVHN